MRSSDGKLKADAAEAVVETLRPLRERCREFAEDSGSVQAILADGASRAGDMAAKTLERARSAIGLLPAKPGESRSF